MRSRYVAGSKPRSNANDETYVVDALALAAGAASDGFAVYAHHHDHRHDAAEAAPRQG